MGVRVQKSVEITDGDGRLAYELRSHSDGSISIHTKQVGWSPPRVEVRDLSRALAELNLAARPLDPSVTTQVEDVEGRQKR